MDNIPQHLIEQHAALGSRAILIGWRGSVAHGMHIPSTDPNSIDDLDIMSICVPPISHYYGMREFGTRGTLEIKENAWDIVAYEARKFIKMLARGNPNVISLLWLDKDMYIKLTPAGQLLLDNRDIFATKRMHTSFTEYAKSQLYKMTHLAFEGYMGEKRKRLVQRFGYDTKNAAHLIRLLRMDVEFLKEGCMQVRRPDAAELLAIKRGEWELKKIQEESDRLLLLASKLAAHSSLPDGPDWQEVNSLSVAVVRTAMKDFGE